MTGEKRTGRAAVAIFFAVLMLLGLCTVRDYTGSYDELAEQAILASNMKEYAMALDRIGLSSSYWLQSEATPISRSVEKDHGISGYYLYGLMFPAFETNETVRQTLWSVFTWLWFMLGVWSLYAIARHMGCSIFPALLASLLLYLSPRFFVYGHLNNKDMAVLCMMLATLWQGARFLKRPAISTGLLFSFVGAMATNTRIVAVIAWGIVFACAALKALLERSRKNALALMTTAAGFAACYLLLTPAMWSDPIGFIQYLFSNAAAFSRWSGRLFFRGASFQLPENPLPVYYLAYMMLVTLPLYTFPLAAVGQIRLIRDFFSKPAQFLRDPVKLLLASATGCWVLAFGSFVILRPLVYNGWRHFYFTFAGIAVLAAYGIHVLWEWSARKRWLRRMVALVLCLCFAGTAAGMLLNHPNQGSYYNTLASRNAMETDYWNTSGAGALKRLIACEERNTDLPLEVGCYFIDIQNARFKMTDEQKAALTTTIERDSPYLYYNENYVQVYEVPYPQGYHVLFEVESYGRLVGTMYERDQ